MMGLSSERMYSTMVAQAGDGLGGGEMVGGELGLRAWRRGAFEVFAFEAGEQR